MNKQYANEELHKRNIGDQKYIININLLTNERNKNSNNNKKIIFSSTIL